MTKKDRVRCGYCKYLQSDGMFGLWCDKGLNWEEVEYCEYFERNMRRMTEKELIDELNYLSKKNRKLQFELKECGDNKLFSRRELEKENKQLKMENNSLKLLVQNWEALDEEKDEQLDRQNQALIKLKKENEKLKEDKQALIEFITTEFPISHKTILKGVLE